MAKGSVFPARDVKRLVEHLEKVQHCKVKRTTKGYWVGFPNGNSTTLHLTCSDPRAIKNVRAIVLKNGCAWPL